MDQENTFVLKGVIKSIGTTQVITDKFKKKSVVIDITRDEKWPKVVEVEFINGAIDKIRGKSVGQRVSIGFNPESRPSKDGTRYYTSIRGYSITDAVGNADSSTQTPAPGNEAPDMGGQVEDYPF